MSSEVIPKAGNHRLRLLASASMLLGALVVGLVVMAEIACGMQARQDNRRFVHQVADIVSRQTSVTAKTLDGLAGAWQFLMTSADESPLLNPIELQVVSVGGPCKEQTASRVLWHYTSGDNTPVDLQEFEGLTSDCESVLQVKAQFRYMSPLRKFLGIDMRLADEALARPREERFVTFSGRARSGAEFVQPPQ